MEFGQDGSRPQTDQSCCNSWVISRKGNVRQNNGVNDLHKIRKEVAEAVQEYDSLRRKVDDIMKAKLKAELDSSEVIYSDSDA